jgi:hypothetical protein
MVADPLPIGKDGCYMRQLQSGGAAPDSRNSIIDQNHPAGMRRY